MTPVELLGREAPREEAAPLVRLRSRSGDSVEERLVFRLSCPSLRCQCFKSSVCKIPESAHSHNQAKRQYTTSAPDELERQISLPLRGQIIYEFSDTIKIMAKMLKRQCAFCPEDEECSIMYVAEGQTLAVHQDCLLYSSGFVESEDYDPKNLDERFDVASVMNELKRGKRLICNFCRKKGATVGCEVKHCRRSYHYFCALCDDAALETDEGQGIYRVFCPNHDPERKANLYDEDSKRERSPITIQSSSPRKRMNEKKKIAEDSLQALQKKQERQKVRVEFLRKCQRAGLLDEIFEEMLDALHLAQEKLMDDNTSEAEYEETVISLFDCGLFENILANAHSGAEGKIQELLETRKRLDTQIELLKDLKVVLPASEDASNYTSE